jgi:hypothetical protein
MNFKVFFHLKNTSFSTYIFAFLLQTKHKKYTSQIPFDQGETFAFWRCSCDVMVGVVNWHSESSHCNQLEFAKVIFSFCWVILLPLKLIILSFIYVNSISAGTTSILP